MKRILTGLCIGIVLVAMFALRQLNLYIFDIFMGVLTVFAAMEVGKLLAKADKNSSIFAITLFPAFMYLWLLIGVSVKLSLMMILLGAMVGLIVASIIVFIVFLCQRVKTIAKMQVANYEGSKFSFCLNATLSTAFGFIIPTFMLLLGILFNHMEVFASELTKISLFTDAKIDLGLIILVAWFATTIMSDVCAYYVGYLFKGKKLCPSISPNKTISGSIGAFVGCIIFAVLAYVIMCSNYELANIFTEIGINYFTVVVFGFLCSLATQIGDLFESALKRKADVKDSGNMLPGHGGIMDRCDGLCFNAVWVLIFFIIVL